jgi:hypothetical protein
VVKTHQQLLMFIAGRMTYSEMCEAYLTLVMSTCMHWRTVLGNYMQHGHAKHSTTSGTLHTTHCLYSNSKNNSSRHIRHHCWAIV